MKAQEVIIGNDDGCGRITLNRPKAINALNFDMCRTIIAALQSWEFDPEVAAIIIDHSAGRGFCAGGDLRALYENIRTGGGEVLDFFRTEYRLDHLLFTLAKPSVCFMDGIVMGGGAGIAMPCRYRVATESTVFAMPETGIGFFPDVGAGWFLSRLPDRIGQWLALTGARLGGADCLRLGLATHYLPRDELASVKARIRKAPDELEVILSDASVSPPPARIDTFHTDIDRLFAPDRIQEIFTLLIADPSPWASEQLAEIRKKSPRSCKVALRALAACGKLAQFYEIMQLEYRVASRLARKPDFSEGVRAFVIDKDDSPKWLPPRLEDVSEDEIDAIFAPLSEDEEWDSFEEEMTMAVIGFIGLGNMGCGMAANLVKAGHVVRAFDVSAAALSKAAEIGAMGVSSVTEAVTGAAAVVTMLQTGQQARHVYEKEAFTAASPEAILIDCSTIDVATARAIGEAAAASGLGMVDAPVSGGVAGAVAATLTFMVGGTDKSFAMAQPILAAMGKTVIHAGPAGSGQAAKICNNMLLGASMIATAEAFNLAIRLGLDPQVFFDISSKASGQCWSMTSYCPVPGPVPAAPSNRDYDGGFMSALMLKDLKLAMAASQETGASVPMGALAESLYQNFVNLGGAPKDFSAIIKLLDGSWRAPS